MESAHHEGHHHGLSKLDNLTKAFYIGIALNLFFTVVEFILGYVYNSLALLSDASHNLSDVASLFIALIGLNFSKKAASLSYTYGYKRASILASFINSIILIVVVIYIVKEAIERINNAPEVIGEVIIITALIGVVINTVSAFLFHKGQKDDINVRGAFLHLIVDAVVSLGVVISGIVIYYTDLNVVDPIISIVIAVVILITTWDLFKESLKLILDGVPKGIDVQKTIDLIQKIDGIKEIHHVHIWAISSSINAFSAHVIMNGDCDFEEWIEMKLKVRLILNEININHVTLELDDEVSFKGDMKCE